MRIYSKTIRVNALQSIVIVARRYRDNGHRWSIFVSGMLSHNNPLFGCQAINTDKNTILTMLDCYISLAKQEGIYFPDIYKGASK